MAMPIYRAVYLRLVYLNAIAGIYRAAMGRGVAWR
jgi:hypothetical protein